VAAADASACHDEVIASDPGGAGALAVDGDVVFWGTNDGLVRKREAGVTTTLAAEPAAISGIAVDATNVYYASIGAVRRVPRAGGAATDLVPNAGEPFAVATSTEPAPFGASVYWVNYGSGILAGSAHSIAPSGAGGVDLAVSLDTPGGLAVGGGHVYLTCALSTVNQEAVEGPLLRVDLDGANLEALTHDLHDPKGVTLFGGRVYFIEQTGAPSGLHGGVRSIDPNGGAPKIELATEGLLPIDLAVDESGVYATALSQPKAVLLHDGAEIASTPSVVYESVRTSKTAVYWTIGFTSTPHADGASVRKLCK
jgi:hypothetical protein